MRLVSYNLLNGGIGRADPIGEVLEAQRADLIVLIEADDPWVIERIAKRLNMDHVTGQGDKHAAAVLSRFPVACSINHAAIDPAGPRSWVEVSVEPPDAPPLTVHALHLHPHATVADESRRTAQLARVLAATRLMRERREPHVLAGDFNANAPRQRIDVERCTPSTRHAFADNGGVVPRDAIELLQQHGYVDSLAAVHADAAYEQATFTTHMPGQRVDYVFTHGLVARDAWVECDRLATYASDHYPVGVDLPLCTGR